MKISLLHPSRQRPFKSFDAAHHWLSNVKHKKNIEYILSLDVDDPALNEYRNLWDDLNLPNGKLIVNDNRSLVDAANKAAEESSGELIVLMSDDMTAPQHWDELLITELKGKSDYLVRTFDGAQRWLITLPIMHRKYYERFGYIYHPEFFHLFCDTQQTHEGELLGKIVDLSHITFKHEHYTTGLNPKDSLNLRNDATWNQGESIYLQHAKNNFGLSSDEIKGRVTNMEHLEWLQKKGIRQ